MIMAKNSYFDYNSDTNPVKSNWELVDEVPWIDTRKSERRKAQIAYNEARITDNRLQI